MKILLKMMLILGALVLVGCGGGGSSATSEEGALSYSGKISKVILDENNTKYFVELVNASFSNAVSSTVSPKVNKIASLHKMSQKIIEDTAPNLKVIDSTSRAGNISGQVSLVVEETGTYTGTITYTYKNFSDVEGIVVNGKVINYLTVNSNEVLIKSILAYQMLNIKIQGEDVTLDGKITSTPTASGSTLVENYVVKNNKASEMIKYDNYKTHLNKQGQIVSYGGKIYDSNYGYVNVSTLAPLAYNEDGSHKAEGEVLLKGEASSATIKYAYDNRLRVEIDVDKDGSVDDVQVYRVGKYEQEIPNAAPVINISFPQRIYTDTDMSAVEVTIYDPDLDGVTVTNQWQINGVDKSTEVILDNALFVKHDMLKLTVTATDDRAGDAKTSTEMKRQEVLNSAPKIVLKLDKTTIEVGDKIVVDASKSYDADGDEFTFEWNTQDRKYNVHDDAYNLGYKYLDINESNRSKVFFIGEDVNYNYIGYGEIMPYGVGLELNDMDINGTSETRSENIFVNVMDVFNTKVTTLENLDASFKEATTIGVGDINKDGLKDIVVAMQDTAYKTKLMILLQNNEQSFILDKTIELNDISYGEVDSISIGDFNHDGNTDIAYSFSVLQGFEVLYQNSDNVFNKIEYTTKTFAYVPFPAEPDRIDYLSNSVKYLSSSDVNNDGVLDIVTIGTNSMASGSTGMNIFLQSSGDLNDTQMLALDNRTIEDDGQYEISDSHKVNHIKIEDIDNDGLKDIFVENYIEYQEDNGTYTEKSYDKSIDALAFIDLNGDKNKEMIAIKGFDNELFVYNSVNNRAYEQINVLDIYSNAFQIEHMDINSDEKKDIILGHNAMGFFSVLVQNKKNEFYGSQLYPLDDKINFLYHKKAIWVEDMNNDGMNDIIYLGSNGFELFSRKNK